ncbi:MAG: hypothetical protein WDZ59_07250 [Pirellulales bacterium]
MLNRVMPPPSRADRRAIRWIMLAVAVWGVLLALGTYLYVERVGMRIRPIAAALVVLVCTAAFLGLWAAVLARRGR